MIWYILENNDNNSLSNALQINFDKLIKLIKQPCQTNEEQSRDSKHNRSHSAVNLSSESLDKIAHIVFSDIKIEESSHQQESKFIPKELKDCPECGKPTLMDFLQQCHF